MYRLLAFVALAACHPVANETSFDDDPVHHGTEFHILGSTKSIYSYWGARCSEQSMWDKSNKYGTEPCDTKTFTLAVSCRGCEVKVSEARVGTATAEVMFTQLGPVTIHAVSTRTDNNEVRAVDSKPIVVTLPDNMAMACSRDGDPCGPGGVDASDPQVYPRVSFRGNVEYSTALRINGQVIGGYSLGVSLATLYPDAKAGPGGVVPGTYDIDLSLGGTHQVFRVVAR